MKICRITSQFPPSKGGLSFGIYELTEVQKQLGYKIVVLTKNIKGENEIYDNPDYEVIRLKAKRNLIFSYLAARWILKNNKRYNFDIIHAHGSDGFFIEIAKQIFSGKIPPIILSAHTLRKYQYEQYAKYDLFKKTEQILGIRLKKYRKIAFKKWRMFLNIESIIEKWAYKKADFVASVAEYLVKEIEKSCDVHERKIDTILNGVNLQRIGNNNKDDLKKILSIPEQTKVLLYVGRLEFTKGCQDLIISIEFVKKKYNQPIKLLLVGSGDAEPLLRKLVKKMELVQDIIFLSYVPYKDIFDYYRMADLFILPSYSEALPKVVLEAMASGTAVVVSDIMAHKNLIDDNKTGYFFETGNIDNLTSTIVAALNDDDDKRASISSNAKILVEKHYSWQAVAKRLDCIYKTISGKKKNYPNPNS